MKREYSGQSFSPIPPNIQKKIAQSSILMQSNAFPHNRFDEYLSMTNGTSFYREIFYPRHLNFTMLHSHLESKYNNNAWKC